MNSQYRTASWRGYVGLSLAWLAILGIVLLVTRRPTAAPIEIIPPPTPLPTASPLPTATPAPMRIDVSGAVQAPGIYMLPAGSIVADAIAVAGGPAADADLDRVNKAAPLQDGTQVYIPRVAEAVPLPLLNLASPTQGPEATPAAAGSAGPGQRININTATLAELDTLPGVGPATAQRIIDGRPYSAVEDLLRVKGIGPATFEKLKDFITVE